jgi:hypothetical protein
LYFFEIKGDGSKNILSKSIPEKNLCAFRASKSFFEPTLPAPSLYLGSLNSNLLIRSLASSVNNDVICASPIVEVGFSGKLYETVLMFWKV